MSDQEDPSSFDTLVIKYGQRVTHQQDKKEAAMKQNRSPRKFPERVRRTLRTAIKSQLPRNFKGVVAVFVPTKDYVRAENRRAAEARARTIWGTEKTTSVLFLAFRK